MNNSELTPSSVFGKSNNGKTELERFIERQSEEFDKQRKNPMRSKHLPDALEFFSPGEEEEESFRKYICYLMEHLYMIPIPVTLKKLERMGKVPKGFSSELLYEEIWQDFFEHIGLKDISLLNIVSEPHYEVEKSVKSFNSIESGEVIDFQDSYEKAVEFLSK